MPSKDKPTTFVRNATGLVRSVSAFDVLAYGVISGGAITLIPLGILSLPSIYEGVSIPLILALSIIPIFAIAFTVTLLSSSMPRAGGDYVFGSRVVHPVWGMVASFMWMFTLIVGTGSLALLTIQGFLGPAILVSFPQYTSSVVSLLYTPSTVFVVVALLLVGLIVLAALSTRAWFLAVRIFFIYGLIMMVVLIGYLLTVPKSVIISNFNGQLATGFNYSDVLSNATSAGWSPTVAATPLSTAGAMIFILFFLTITLPAFFAGEIKHVSKSMLIGEVGGSILSLAVATVAILAWVGAFGYSFLSAFGYEAYLNPTTAPTGAFNANALVLAIVGSPALAFLIGLAFALVTLGLTAVTIIPSSRIFFAWGFDRLIPARFCSVSDRTHTPLFSFAVFGLLVMVMAAIDCFFASYIGPFLATTLLLMAAYLPNGVSALLLPYRRKSIFDASPALVKKKFGPVPLVSLAGLVQTISVMLLLVLVFLNPAAAGTSNGTLGSGALAVIVVALTISIIFYPISKAIRKRSGIDLSLVYREIPPE